MPFLSSFRRQVARIVSKCRCTPHDQEIDEDSIEHAPPPRTHLFKDWYTDPTLPSPWSTDWDDWAYLLRLFEETVDGKLKIDKLFKEVFDIPGSVEPVAYMRGACGEVWLFTAGGRYYFWSDGYVAVHRMEFASPKEFLAYALQGKSPGEHLPDVQISMLPGKDLSWL